MRLPSFRSTTPNPHSSKRLPSIARGMVTVIVLVAMIASCHEDPEYVNQVVRLVNNDDTPVHLFTDVNHETFPCCQLAAGGSREITFSHEKEAHGSTSFSAGRNGTILTTVACTLYSQAAVVDVVFANGQLTCFGW